MQDRRQNSKMTNSTRIKQLAKKQTQNRAKQNRRGSKPPGQEMRWAFSTTLASPDSAQPFDSGTPKKSGLRSKIKRYAVVAENLC